MPDAKVRCTCGGLSLVLEYLVALQIHYVWDGVDLRDGTAEEQRRADKRLRFPQKHFAPKCTESVLQEFMKLSFAGIAAPPSKGEPRDRRGGASGTGTTDTQRQPPELLPDRGRLNQTRSPEACRYAGCSWWCQSRRSPPARFSRSAAAGDAP